jgi:predicted O-methyltransferase YrrM
LDKDENPAKPGIRTPWHWCKDAAVHWIARGLHKLLWAKPGLRRQFQRKGLHVLPANFYSNIPSQDELDASFEYTESQPPYLLPGLFNAAEMKAHLNALIPHSAEFEPPQLGDEATCETYFWGNSQFIASDAMAYYAHVRQAKPKRVVEVGSGFSSLIALQALQRNGFGELICIEPYPRPFIVKLAEQGKLRLIRKPVQTIAAQEFDALLGDGDILFIDSTHTVKSGSDCMHLYLRVLPQLSRQLLIHVHDVFLPFGMPKHWAITHHIHWTEQHLLLALTIGNPRFKWLFGSAYHEHTHPTELTQLMHGRSVAGGSSVWLRHVPGG